MQHVSAALRRATPRDLDAILRIYNEGIEDRLATLEVDSKTRSEIEDWWAQHDEKYAVVVAEIGDSVVGWASLNHFSHRCAHAAIADLSVYVARSQRGRGFGKALLEALEVAAGKSKFHKIVLHALDENQAGKRLYRRSGFAEVGVFREHGMLDGRYVDVVAMEKLLESSG